MARLIIAPGGYPDVERFPGQDITVPIDPPPDPSGRTVLDRLRLLIPDAEPAGPGRLLDDDDLLDLLAMEGVTSSTAIGPADGAPLRAVRLAAANALDVIASSTAMVAQKIRTQDLSTDGPAVAAELRARASTLRTMVEAADLAEAALVTGSGIIEFGDY